MEHEVARRRNLSSTCGERPAGADHLRSSGSSHRVQGLALVAISQLRDVLGVAYLHVARTNEPVIVARYGWTDVAMVPLWEWRWLKQIEEAIDAGVIDA